MSTDSRPASHMQTAVALVSLAVCLAVAIGLQVARDRLYATESRATQRILYVRSGDTVKRLALSFDALLADVYWIRAIQHYGGERLTAAESRNFDLLLPLLDLTTALDPYFSIAYRFGGIFLSEPAPGEPGLPGEAVKLLERGVAAQPEKWQYLHDIGFIYFNRRDFPAAATWFQRAAEVPGAPNWLRPLAASVLGGSRNERAASRFLWNQILQSDEEWLRQAATRNLQQLDALDAIDQLQAVVRRFPPAPGQAYAWTDFVGRRILRAIPVDPTGEPFDIDASTGTVSLSPKSALHPLPPHMTGGGAAS